MLFMLLITPHSEVMPIQEPENRTECVSDKYYTLFTLVNDDNPNWEAQQRIWIPCVASLRGSGTQPGSRDIFIQFH